MAFPGKRPEVNAAMTLPAVATAIAPSYTEGDCVPLSIYLAGKLRTDSTGGGGGGMTQTPAWDTPRRFHLWRR